MMIHIMTKKNGNYEWRFILWQKKMEIMNDDSYYGKKKWKL